MIPITLKQRTEVFGNVVKVVPTKIFAPAFDATKWKALVNANRQRILEADSVEAFESEVQKLIAELKISHMAFFHRSFLKIPPNYAIGATFQAYGANGNSSWMFQDVHEGGPAYLSNMRPGDLLLEIEGTPVVPPDMPAFRMGGFSTVTIERLTGERVPLPLGIPMPKSKWHPIVRPKLVSWYKPEPGVGVLKATGFPGQVGIDVAREIDEAVANLQDCTQLIVDLRGNPGGGAGGLRLMGYFTPGKLPVGYSLSRKRVANGYKREDIAQVRQDTFPENCTDSAPFLLRSGRQVHSHGYRGAWAAAVSRPDRSFGQSAHRQRRRDHHRVREGKPARDHRRYEDRGPGFGRNGIQNGPRIRFALASGELPHLGREQP